MLRKPQPVPTELVVDYRFNTFNNFDFLTTYTDSNVYLLKAFQRFKDKTHGNITRDDKEE